MPSDRSHLAGSPGTEDFKTVTERDLLPTIPFARLVGIEITFADPTEVRGYLEWTADRCTSTGILHGGALMALGDTLGSVCAFLNLPAHASTTTIESKTNFFRPVQEGHVKGTAQPLHVGRSIIVIQTDLVDYNERAIGRVTQSQAVIRQPDPTVDSQ